MDEKLEKFLLLAKTTRGPGLGDLISKVTAESGIYRFGELLALPQVQEVWGGLLFFLSFKQNQITNRLVH